MVGAATPAPDARPTDGSRKLRPIGLFKTHRWLVTFAATTAAMLPSLVLDHGPKEIAVASAAVICLALSILYES